VLPGTNSGLMVCWRLASAESITPTRPQRARQTEREEGDTSTMPAGLRRRTNHHAPRPVSSNWMRHSALNGEDERAWSSDRGLDKFLIQCNEPVIECKRHHLLREDYKRDGIRTKYHRSSADFNVDSDAADATIGFIQAPRVVDRVAAFRERMSTSIPSTVCITRAGSSGRVG